MATIVSGEANLEGGRERRGQFTGAMREAFAPLRRDPEISVLIMSSMRRAEQFLPGAVRSVLDQTLDRRAYTVTVIADFVPDLSEFRGEGIDLIVLDKRIAEKYGWLGRGGFSDTIPVGFKIAAGLEATAGRIITPLDDDDRFLPDKLETVLNIFNTIPDLGFLVSNFSIRTVGEEPGRRIAMLERRTRDISAYSTPLVIPGETKLSHMSLFTDLAFAFNSSRMAFLREIIEPESLRYVGHTVDDLIFFAAVAASGLSMAMDPNARIEYTVHGGSMTSPSSVDDYRTSRILWLESHVRIAELYGGIIEIAERQKQITERLRYVIENAESELAKIYSPVDTELAKTIQ